ncbi:MAG: RIO1 family regulatory kinase/ATPase [Acidobacteriota bacterium]
MNRWNWDEDSCSAFEHTKRRVRRPRGMRSIRELCVSAEVRAIDDDAPTFADPGLEALHEEGLLEELCGQVASGKEATVYVGRGQDGLLAVKVYKDLHARSFHGDGVYRDGRFVGGARIEKAIRQRSRTGIDAQQALWVTEEFRQLRALRDAGVSVPRPIGSAGRVVLMELIGDEDGPAPRLSEARLTPTEATEAFSQCVANLARIVESGRVHGDYSAHNVLWWKGRAVVIDFPQVVEIHLNAHAEMLLRRDASSLCASFRRHGVETEPADVLESVRSGRGWSGRGGIIPTTA